MVTFFLLRTTTTVVLVLLFISPVAERVKFASPFTDSITSPGRKPASNADAIWLHIDDQASHRLRLTVQQPAA